MDDNKLAEQLEREGFPHTYIWQDNPNVFYSDHTHPVETAHVILRGELSLTMAEKPLRTGPEKDAMSRQA